MGLGSFGGGVGVTKFLLQHGASVLVTDQNPPEKLKDSLAQLAGLPVEFRLGEHRESDFAEADLIVVNPAVKPQGNAYLQVARDAGVPLTSEIRLLVQRLPNRARTIAITGSAGKSTTTAMIGHILRKGQGTGDSRQETGDRGQETGDRGQETGDRRQGTGDRRQGTGDRGQGPEESQVANLESQISNFKSQISNFNSQRSNPKSEIRNPKSPSLAHPLSPSLSHPAVHLGGNLGGSLLNDLDRIGPDDWVVLELSSFMLEGLREDRWSPHIAVITNLSPNHLDWHGSLESYRDAKQAILDFQDAAGDIAILGDPEPFQPRVGDVRILDPAAMAARDRDLPPLLIPGPHNRVNALMAIEVCVAAGIARQDAIDALDDFAGLPHRLQLVCERAGVRYFNDSKCTTPQAAMLALESFDAGIVHIILGGYDKGSDLAPLARFARKHCAAIYTLGATGDAIADAAEKSSLVAEKTSLVAEKSSLVAEKTSLVAEKTSLVAEKSPHAAPLPANACASASPVLRCGTLARALEETATRIRVGDVVLLSPACASWDQFKNFEERGAAFVAAVLNCTGEGAPTPKRMRG